jgi:hypothetical protein
LIENDFCVRDGIAVCVTAAPAREYGAFEGFVRGIDVRVRVVQIDVRLDRPFRHDLNTDGRQHVADFQAIMRHDIPGLLLRTGGRFGMSLLHEEISKLGC